MTKSFILVLIILALWLFVIRPMRAGGQAGGGGGGGGLTQRSGAF